MPSLSPTDVGGRVVIRLNAGMVDGRVRYTDVLGELLEISDRSLVVRRDDGEELTVAVAQITAAKAVPPRPARYSAITALEQAAASHWPAPETGWLGDWLLRAAGGWSRRANTALAAGDPGVPFAQAIARVEDWYGERGLEPGISVPLPPGRRLAAELDERGWRSFHAVEVRTLPAADWKRVDRPDLPPVRIDAHPGVDVLAMISRQRGELPQVALSVLGGGPRVGFATVRDDAGGLLAMARGAVSDGRLGVSLVQTAADARRRGLATYAMDALVSWAGADEVYLQVERNNPVALAMYDRLGFTVHHTYTVYQAPSAS